MGDVVVLLPGITGSVLAKDGKDAFGLTVSAGLRALFSAGRSLDGLALAGEDPDVDDLGDGVSAVRLAVDAHLVPGLWKIDGYGKVFRRLGQVPGVEVHPFPYDWRRDNRVAARQLQREANRWLAERRAQDRGARLVLVAHSMGGLVARYFLEVLGGWRDTRLLITFGTPFQGSMNALGFLTNGMTKLGGLIDLTDVLRSCTSVYQLLPTYRCMDEGDGRLLRLTELTRALPYLDPDRVSAARTFHQEIEEAVQRNSQDTDYVEHGYTLRHIVSAEHPTRQSARFVDGRVTLLDTWPDQPDTAEDHGGDGTVPRFSATPVDKEDDSGAFFSGTRHASLQNADGVLTHVFRVLTTLRPGAFRGERPTEPVALEVDDVYGADEPVRIRLRPATPGAILRVELEALTHVSATDSTSPEPPPASGLPPSRASLVAGLEVEGAEDWTVVDLPPQVPGCYRVTVSGDVEPASDLVVVAPEGDNVPDRLDGRAIVGQ
jgi:hypothetical protein